MSDNNLQRLTSEAKKETESFNIQLLLGHLIYYWWLFGFFVLSSFFTAYIYLRYTTPSYKITAKILVKDSKKGGDLNEGSVFSDLELLNPISSVDNEVELLKARTLMEKTVRELQLNTRYFTKGSVKQIEVFFQKLPFVMTTDITEDSLLRHPVITFSHVDNNSFTVDDGLSRRKARFEDTVSLKFGKLVFHKNNIISSSTSPVIIKFYPKDEAVAYFQGSYTVASTSKTVSTIDLALNDAIPDRGELILNTLIRIYNNMNTEDRNRIADSTISFIDTRLVFVTQQLGDVEKDIQVYKQNNNITDMSMQSQLLLQNTSQYMHDLAQQEVQIDILGSLEVYLKNDKNFSRTIPASLAVQDPSFEALVQNYNTLQLEKQRQLSTTTENNPVVQKLTVQIANLRSSILGSLGTVARTMSINRDQLKKRSDFFGSQIKKVPQKEKDFLEISRQQVIKQELYLYLLKKREETAVSKAANMANARMVDAPKGQGSPFSPKKNVIYMIALLAGLLIPGLILYARDLFNNKVESKKDITNVTAAPIVGEIERSLIGDNMVIQGNPRHPVAEQFRMLRTNLDYMVPATITHGRTILITSSTSGEGKSFLSLNLAALLAYNGKKVVLLEFDLRKPKLSKYLKLENNEGLTSYLIGKNNNINSLMKTVPGIENLYLFSSGVIPPNPAELINTQRTSTLFEDLKNQFDHIVMDVPPIGIVTDTLLLAQYADISLYVVRQKYTFKYQLDLLNELYQQKKLPNMGIVVNDIKRQNKYGYGYGYGYGYYSTGEYT